jgi:hypothetical protein
MTNGLQERHNLPQGRTEKADLLMVGQGVMMKLPDHEDV